MSLFEVEPGTDHDEQAPAVGAGTRLHRIEIFNWGTFHEKVWTLDLGGRNALLTGDIGSGKSTMVDAVTTLLVPAQRISYNKAAGAETRERDLRSYVLGFYKSERNEEAGGSRPVGLRGPEHFSVILGVFRDVERATTTTLAQVFRAREDTSQPERFFVVFDGELSITEHFSNPGDSLADLRKQLKTLGANVSDGFNEYRRSFRRRLGITSDQALDLFLQTVSMKAVDNLNEFVRSHMLEPVDMSKRIDALVAHFDDLTKAHDAVVRARDQLELLVPLVGHLDAYDEHSEAAQRLGRLIETAPFYFATAHDWLLEIKAERLAGELDRLQRLDADIGTRLDQLRTDERHLHAQIDGNGGNRLALIESELRRLRGELPRRQHAVDEHNRKLEAVGLEPVGDEAQFIERRSQLGQRERSVEAERVDVDNKIGELTVRDRDERVAIDEITNELDSLAKRRSNIPSRSLELRERLIGDLRLTPDELVFAGELMAIDDQYDRWEGAAERVLHSFALSLLVPNERYREVAAWIDSHHLRGRIVYYRVPERVAPAGDPNRHAAYPLLMDMVNIRPDTPFAEFIRRELTHRADYLCVPDTSTFSTLDRAITPAGQIKSKDRHEKDDRSRIDDRSRYVLGWDNRAKVEALRAERETLIGNHAESRRLLDVAQADQRRLISMGTTLIDLARVDDWVSLDVESLTKQVEDLSGEHETLRAASVELQALTAQLDAVVAKIVEESTERDSVKTEIGRVTGEAERTEAQRNDLQQLLGLVEAEVARGYFDELEEHLGPEHRRGALQLDGIDSARSGATEGLRSAQHRATERAHGAERQAERAMAGFRARFQRETAELDASVAAGPEYREMYERVRTDDLPRFEAEFRTSLRENTIKEIAQLSADLEGRQRDIRRHIDTINGSLHEIDYNPGRFIRLLPEATPNTEIRGFRDELRAVTSRTTNPGDDDYSEHRFLQVKALIDRFVGREGSTDQDRAWTKRVTDVRNWFVFSASERWRSDDTEYENYADSSGKSGGQKEKLAYTVLAASLAYQFSHGSTAGAGSFRFVAIDEAFGRGSDESTRFGLRLFRTLGLQLLIVTPLQKIRVIEPFVSTVGYVVNPEENNSQLVQMTMSEHHRRRESAGQA